MAGIIIVIAIFYLRARGRMNRTEEMRSFAARMQYGFAPETHVPEEISSCHLFSHYRSGECRNLIRIGENNDFEVTVFDYYIQCHNQNWVIQTVVFLENENLSLPRFYLRPEGLEHKAAALFGAQDIDFPSHPRFSSRYLLQGEDEGAIRKTFAPKVLDYLEQKPGLFIEGGGGCLILYNPRQKLPTGKIMNNVNQALSIGEIFRH